MSNLAVHSTFSDLAQMQRWACATYGPRQLFGTKADGRWRWSTYAEFGRRVASVRAGFAALGVGHGDCVAIIAGNREEWAVAAYATFSLGARFTPMYEHQDPADWKYILRDSRARVVVVSNAAIAGRLEPLVGRKKSELKHIVDCSLSAENPGSFEYLAKLKSGDSADNIAPSDIAASDIAALIYTSGTTGKPKGVVLTHGNITSNINAIATYMPQREQDVSLSFLPWAHSFGQTCELHLLISMGGAMGFAESIPKLAANLAEVRPTVLYAVPRVFNRIYDSVRQGIAAQSPRRQKIFEAAVANARLRADLDAKGQTSVRVDLQHLLYDRLVFSKVRARFGGRLQFAFSGGAALSAEVASFIDCLGITILEGYGLTETSPIAAANRPGARKIGSVGLPIPGVEIRLETSAVDEESAAAGQGEIWIRGPNVMQGYFGQPKASAAVLVPTADGGPWFRSGDKGRFDADGFLYITGRIKEQYKLENGKYVVPAPLEEALTRSPLIGQAFVFGGNRPFNVALIVPDPEGIVRWGRDNGVGFDWATVVGQDRTRIAIEAEVQRLSADFRGYERPRRVRVLANEFTVDNGMMTPKMSLRRPQIERTYQDKLDELYANDGDS